MVGSIPHQMMWNLNCVFKMISENISISTITIYRLLQCEISMSFKVNNPLLNKNIVNSFSYSMLVVLLLMLLWIVYDKHNVFIQNKKDVAYTAVTNTKDAIQAGLETKKRILDNFVDDHRNEILRLIVNPADKALFKFLHKKLKKQLPDLFTINIFKEDDGLITQVDNFVGQLCKQDLEDYLVVSNHIKRTHPSDVLYHYDEISSVKYKDDLYLFFSSFSLQEIATVVQHSTPEGHNIVIVSDVGKGNIEITAEGVRDPSLTKTQPIVTDMDSEQIISRINIPGTKWMVVDVQDDSEVSEHLYSLLLPAVLVYFLVASIILFMRSILNGSFELLNSMNSELMLINKEVVGLNKELEVLSLTDSLTGLYNRRYFDHQFTKEWNRALRNGYELSVMIFDIDYFKKYNDHYGHVEGDKCLIKVATILKSFFNRSNEFVARYGGEEFVAVLNCNKNRCLDISDSIHKKLADACIEHAKTDASVVTVSIGVTSKIPVKEEDSLDMVNRADEALYRAKNKGRNKTEFYSDV